MTVAAAVLILYFTAPCLRGCCPRNAVADGDKRWVFRLGHANRRANHAQTQDHSPEVQCGTGINDRPLKCGCTSRSTCRAHVTSGTRIGGSLDNGGLPALHLTAVVSLSFARPQPYQASYCATMGVKICCIGAGYVGARWYPLTNKWAVQISGVSASVVSATLTRGSKATQPTAGDHVRLQVAQPWR